MHQSMRHAHCPVFASLMCGIKQGDTDKAQNHFFFFFYDIVISWMVPGGSFLFSFFCETHISCQSIKTMQR